MNASLVNRTLKLPSRSVFSKSISSQVFGVPTYDALFKSVLNDSNVRPSFFHAFIPNIKVEESQRLDEHMNPLQEFQILRETLNKPTSLDRVTSLKNSFGYKLMVKQDINSNAKYDKQGTKLVKFLFDNFEDLVNGFPKKRYDGSMDFVCRLGSGEYALVEAQIIRQDYWDKRALAYVAAFYGNQLRSGGEWKDIKKVIGVNILGGGVNDNKYWVDSTDQFMRHYKFQEQIQKPSAINVTRVC